MNLIIGQTLCSILSVQSFHILMLSLFYTWVFIPVLLRLLALLFRRCSLEAVSISMFLHSPCSQPHLQVPSLSLVMFLSRLVLHLAYSTVVQLSFGIRHR